MKALMICITKPYHAEFNSISPMGPERAWLKKRHFLFQRTYLLCIWSARWLSCWSSPSWSPPGPYRWKAALENKRRICYTLIEVQNSRLSLVLEMTGKDSANFKGNNNPDKIILMLTLRWCYQIQWKLSLTVFVPAQMWPGRGRGFGFSGLVDCDDAELVPFALAQSGNACFELLNRGHAILEFKLASYSNNGIQVFCESKKH